MEVLTRQGLPATWYFDEAQFEREMSAIWARHWICVGRADEWKKSGDARSDGAAVKEWGGFVFLNRSASPGAEFDELAAEGASALSGWPLARLSLAHREVHEVACNWKVFWENYLECYHCPGVHPELCRLVPLYGRGLTNPADLPPDHALRDAPLLKAGALTWSADGQTPLPDLPGLGENRLAAGMTFGDFPPGMFVIAHRDHARSVRVMPLAPEGTQLTVEWLLEAETLSDGVDIERLVAFGHRVVMEDARICEVNQAGLRCRAHEHGMLLPIERDVAAFDDWVRRCVGQG